MLLLRMAVAPRIVQLLDWRAELAQGMASQSAMSTQIQAGSVADAKVLKAPIKRESQSISTEDWFNLIVGVKKLDAPLAAKLEHAAFLKIDGGTLHLAVRKDKKFICANSNHKKSSEDKGKWQQNAASL